MKNDSLQNATFQVNTPFPSFPQSLFQSESMCEILVLSSNFNMISSNFSMIEN